MIFSLPLLQIGSFQSLLWAITDTGWKPYTGMQGFGHETSTAYTQSNILGIIYQSFEMAGWKVYFYHHPPSMYGSSVYLYMQSIFFLFTFLWLWCTRCLYIMDHCVFSCDCCRDTRLACLVPFISDMLMTHWHKL